MWYSITKKEKNIALIFISFTYFTFFIFTYIIPFSFNYRSKTRNFIEEAPKKEFNSLDSCREEYQRCVLIIINQIKGLDAVYEGFRVILFGNALLLLILAILPEKIISDRLGSDPVKSADSSVTPGTNSYSNAQVLSRQNNRNKSNHCE